MGPDRSTGKIAINSLESNHKAVAGGRNLEGVRRKTPGGLRRMGNERRKGTLLFLPANLA